MKFNTIKEGERISSYEVKRESTLHNPKITTSFWGDILRGFKNTGELKNRFSNIFSLGDMNIIEAQNSSFILEFQDETKRNETQKILEQKIVIKNTFMSEELENGRQIPGVDGTFEREGKFYIIVHSYLKNTDETNPNLGIYKGSIVDPRKYFEGGDSINNVSDSYRDNVDEIIGNG